MRSRLFITFLILLVTMTSNALAWTAPCNRDNIHQESIIDDACYFEGEYAANFGDEKARCLNALIAMMNYYNICNFNCSRLTLQRYDCSVCLFNAVNHSSPYATSADIRQCFKEQPVNL